MTVENRLAQLRNEVEKGRIELEKLEQRRQEIYSTLLRISGAIQVLEEMREDRQLDVA
jgi:hypothetical protein